MGCVWLCTCCLIVVYGVSSVPDSEPDSLPGLDPIQACFSTQRSSYQPLNMTSSSWAVPRILNICLLLSWWGMSPTRQALQLRVSTRHQGCWSRCPTSPRNQGQTGLNLHSAARVQCVSDLCLWVTPSWVRAGMCVVCFCLRVCHHGHRLAVLVNGLSLPMLTAFTSQGFGAQANLR